jgi:acyl-CoA hydrolase
VTILPACRLVRPRLADRTTDRPEPGDGRQISGIGSSIDFIEGGMFSPGEERIINLPLATPNGKICRIVPRLGESSAVTIPSALVEIIVTEHGVARMEGRSTREGIEALAAIAAPQHQEELLDAVP